MTYLRVINSRYARYKRAAGPHATFSVPARRANFGFPIPQALGPRQLANSPLNPDFVAPGGFLGHAKDAVGNAWNGAKDYMMGDGPGQGWAGLQQKAGAYGGQLWDGAQEAFTNGDFSPAEMAAAGVAGLGALGAGGVAMARRGRNVIPEVIDEAAEVVEAAPPGLRQKLAGLSGLQKGGIAAGGVGLAGAGIGGAAYLNNRQQAGY